MKRWLRCGAIAFLAARFSTDVAGGADFAARLKVCESLVAGISPQAATERAACESMLVSGAQTGWWSDEEKHVTEEWLEYVFETRARDVGIGRREFNPYISSRLPNDPAWSSLVDRASLWRDPSSPTRPVLAWLAARLAAMNEVRRYAAGAMLTAAIRQAESAWLSAKMPADLDEAVRGLTETKAVLGIKWTANDPFGSPRIMRPNYPRHFPFTREDTDDFEDCWSIVAAPAPLLFPDPAMDPAAFAAARRDWLLLAKVSHRFVQREAVAQRFEELDNQFRAGFAASQRELNAAILRDASAAEFAPLFLRLKSHILAPPSPQETARLRSAIPPRPQNREVAPDYHDTLAALARTQAHIPGQPPQTQREAELKWRGDFAGWLAWREAEEQGNAGRIETARAALLKNADVFEPRVAAFLKKRLAAQPALAKGGAPDEGKIDAQNPAIAELATALRQRFAGKKNDASAPDVSALIEAWLRFDRDAAGAAGRDVNFTATWQRIASLADGAALCKLRDGAARSALAQVLPESVGNRADVPLTPLFHDALDTCAARGAHEAIARILALDAVAGVLFDPEHRAWVVTIGRLRRALEIPPADFVNAREAWRHVLRTTDSPAVAALVAEKLKAIR